MDPFLEGQEWRDFHHEMISVIRQLLLPSLLPRYLARVQESVFLVPSSEESLARRPEWIVPDVFVAEGEGSAPRAAGGGTATLDTVEPVTLTLPPLVELRQAYLTILYRETREVVTVLELLSPTNKDTGGPGRGQYLEKREKVLRSPAHLVELDLLRGGTRLPTVEALPPGDYYALVTRAPHRPEVAVYAWPLARPLPSIPIPLAGEDPDAMLDLQAAFTAVYDRAAYAYSIDYQASLVPPPNDTDAAWVQQVLAEAKLR
jgi:hypothetical protein